MSPPAWTLHPIGNILNDHIVHSTSHVQSPSHSILHPPPPLSFPQVHLPHDLHQQNNTITQTPRISYHIPRPSIIHNIIQPTLLNMTHHINNNNTPLTLLHNTISPKILPQFILLPLPIYLVPLSYGHSHRHIIYEILPPIVT